MKTSEFLILIITVILSIVALANAIIAYINVKKQIECLQDKYFKYSKSASFYSKNGNKVNFKTDDKFYLSSKENIQQEIPKNEIHRKGILSFC